MAWVKRNPPDTGAPPVPVDNDSNVDEFTGGDAVDPPLTGSQQAALDLQQALEHIDTSAVGKYLPYIIPIGIGMSVVSWGAYMYFLYKKSKHYYG